MATRAFTRERLKKTIISPGTSIADSIVSHRAGFGVLLICDEHEKLLGAITDGDFRRALLDSMSMSDSCLKIATKDLLMASFDVSDEEALFLMDKGCESTLNYLPLMEDGKLVGLLLRKDIVPEQPLDICAVVMAGGEGKRLRPLTDNVPKPLLPVGGIPLLERIVCQLRAAGIKKLYFGVHYLAEQIEEFFGDGEKFGLEINYLREKTPLGTGGALRLLEGSESHVLLMNGDVLTKINLRAMFRFHKQHDASITVGICQYKMPVSYGVVRCDGVHVREIREKPELTFFINAGIYFISPPALALLPERERFDMPDFIRHQVHAGYNVIGFPLFEYWLDIGKMEDYQQAQLEVRE